MMASGLPLSFPRASSITTGGSCWRSKKGTNNYYASYYVTRALWHKTGKLSKEYCITTSPQNNLKHHFRSIEVGSMCDKCERKYVMNATSTESHGAEPRAPISKSILESIKDVMDVSFKFSRPHITICMVLSILSTSLLAVENLLDLSPRFFIGLFQYTAGSFFMHVYGIGLNQLVDVEIDKINKPYYPLASGEYPFKTGVVAIASSLFMSFGIGWLVGSRPMLWGLLVTFVLGTAYSINLPLLRWKRFTSLTLVATVVSPLISNHLASFFHMKAHVLKRAVVYPRSLILTLVMMGVHFVVIALVKDIPDMEGDKAGGIQTLAIQFGPERVLWFCVSLLEMAYGVAILVGATSPFLWSKIVMVFTHAIMALVLWYNAKSIDLKSRASSLSFYMTIFKLLYAEVIVIPFAR